MYKIEVVILSVILLIILFFIFQKDRSIEFMNSNIGKLIIFVLIIIFIKIHILYGLFFFFFIIIIFKLYDINNIYYTKNTDYTYDKNDYLDSIDIIYWINLDRSMDRNKHMKKLLKDSTFDNIPTERVVAYDGKQNMEEIWKHLHINNRKASDIEYAVLLSHLHAIQTFANSNNDNKIALIFEDDITLDFKKYWSKPISDVIKNAPDNWEIIQLCFTIYNNNNIPINEYELHKEGYDCAGAYLINRKGANKINKIYKNSKFYIEDKYNHQSDTYIFEKCITYVYKYPYFIWKSGTSSINKNHEISSNRLRNRMIHYMNTVDDINNDNDYNDKFILVTTYYKSHDKQRQKELDKTLYLNVNNKNISKIYLLNDKIYELNENVKYSKKIEQIIINNNPKYKLKFNDAIQFINSKPSNHLYILANSDIYFDDSLQKIKKNNMENKLYALLRYDIDDNNNSNLLIETDKNRDNYGKPNNHSQDTWIFKNPLNINLNNINFALGTYGCDNMFANAAYNSNILLENPSLDIYTYHLHQSNVRTYSNDDKLIGRYCFINPHKLNEKPIYSFYNQK